MTVLKYSIIKTEEQYDKYCVRLEKLLNSDKNAEDEVELLTLLIEKWDNEHNTFSDLDPIQLLKVIMKDNGLRSKDLVDILGSSKSLVSSILNYRRGLSKENIRTLSERFKLSQEAFNRPYKITSVVNKKFRYANLMNTKKDLEKV